MIYDLRFTILKTLRRAALVVLSFVICHSSFAYVTVLTDTNGVLMGPTNFFSTNIVKLTNALTAAGYSAGGGSSSSSSGVAYTTNFMAYGSLTNQFLITNSVAGNLEIPSLMGVVVTNDVGRSTNGMITYSGTATNGVRVYLVYNDPTWTTFSVGLKGWTIETNKFPDTGLVAPYYNGQGQTDAIGNYNGILGQGVWDFDPANTYVTSTFAIFAPAKILNADSTSYASVTATNIYGNFSGNVTSTNIFGTYYGNPTQLSNLVNHATVFLNWWTEIDTMSDSEGSIFVKFPTNGGTFYPFAQAVPITITNLIPASGNKYAYTNGLLVWTGRGTGETTNNTSLFIVMTNYFATNLSETVSLNMACSVPGITSIEELLGRTGLPTSDLGNFYPPYQTNALNQPAINYSVTNGTTAVNLRKCLIVGPLGGNDSAIGSPVSVIVNDVCSIEQKGRAAGDDVIFISYPINYANGAPANINNINTLIVSNNVKFGWSDLNVDLQTHTQVTGQSTNAASWLPDQIHPTLATSTDWGIFAAQEIAKHFAGTTFMGSLVLTNAAGFRFTIGVNAAGTALTVTTNAP